MRTSWTIYDSAGLTRRVPNASFWRATDAENELCVAVANDRSARSGTVDNSTGDDDIRNSRRHQLNHGAAPDRKVGPPSSQRSKQTAQEPPKLQENAVPQVQFLIFWTAINRWLFATIRKKSCECCPEKLRPERLPPGPTQLLIFIIRISA